MSYSEEQYDKFSEHMEQLYPDMFSESYGGFAIGPGWWPIIEALCSQIQSYTNWKNEQFEKYGRGEKVQQVVVEQIKEKFGGLRFYYQGGDNHVSGMVRMAEMWAGRSCEECGAPGESGGKGWIKTLCLTHRAEADARYKARFGDNA